MLPYTPFWSPRGNFEVDRVSHPSEKCLVNKRGRRGETGLVKDPIWKGTSGLGRGSINFPSFRVRNLFPSWRGNLCVVGPAFPFYIRLS